MNGLLVLGGVAQGLPLAAGAAARGRLSTARRWIVAWSIYSLAGLLVEWATRRHGQRNLWWSYIAAPIDGSLVLVALSCWQQLPLWRQAMRWSVPIALVVHLVMLAALENRREFSIASVPIYAVLCFAAALFTLVGRSLTAQEPLARQDWFWITIGLAIYDAAYAVIGPLASALLHTDPGALFLVYQTFQVVNIVGYAVVAVGVLCPAAPAPVRIGA